MMRLTSKKYRHALAAAICVHLAATAEAQVTVTVDAANVLSVMPDVGIGLHTSVYSNNFNQATLPSELAAGGIQLLRYPGGSYADIYHWSNHTATGGYAAAGDLNSDFGVFVTKLLEGSGSQAMVTVNYGSSHQHTMGGQPLEAAAWVAYANGDAGIYNTPDDIAIGVDAEGNNWRTVGYWANLRASTPAQNPDNQYDRFAINRDDPLGIKYWEVGNELNGNGYYSDLDSNWNWENDLHNIGAGADGNNLLLSPTTYGNNFNLFAAAMKAVDPTIQVGAVLVGPGGVGDVADPARNWDRNVLLAAGSNMDFGIVHYYVNNGTSTTQVLNATDDLPAFFDNVRSRIDTYVGPGASDDIELHMNEFGYFGTVSSAEIDGIFAANTYATALADGITSVHWLELNKNSYLGDGVPVRGSAYHGIQVFSEIADAGAEFVQTTSSNGSVEVHSTVLPDGSLGMLIANLNSSGTSTVNVNISNIDLAGTGTEWLYGVNQTIPQASRFDVESGNNFSVNVPFRSILALRIDAQTVVPGDFDGDGDVDGRDFLVWQRGDSPNPVSAEDLADWQEWYSTVPELAASVAVPEPISSALAGLLAVTAGIARHRRA
jgi:hypothetical protein